MTSSSRDRTVAFFGLFGVGNIGNEASLQSALQAQRRFDPDSEPVVVCARPDVVEDQHKVPAVDLAMSGPIPAFDTQPKLIRVAARPFVEAARWFAAVRFLRGVDAVIVPGTGILDDFGERPRGMPYEIFRWTSCARLTRTPLFFVSVGAGPIDHPTSQKLFKQGVINATSCTYRDEISRAFMQRLGVDTGADAVKPDVVLGLERPSALPRSPDAQCIGVGMMAYYGWDNDPDTGTAIFDGYLDSMRQITEALLEQGHQVRLLVGEQTDQIAVDALLTGLSQHAGIDRVVVEPIHSLSDLLDQVNHCDAVVASRYHNIVASMMMSRATVSIGYADKNRALLADAGLDRFAYVIDKIDVDEILAATATALAERTSIADALNTWNDEQVQLIDDHFKEVLASASGS